MQTKKQIVTEFENMLKLAELKALSNYSLETPLTHEQFERMKKLARELQNGIP